MTDKIDKKTLIVPLLPLRDIIVFPHMVVPLFVGREKSIQALENALAQKKDILLVAQRKAKTNDPTEEEIYKVGTAGAIIQLLRLPDGTVKVLIEGRQRVRILRYVARDKFYEVEVEEIHEREEKGPQVEALIRSVKETFESYVKLNKRIPPEMLMTIAAIEGASKLADTVVSHLNLKIEEKQNILEVENPKERLEKLLSLIEGEIEILQIEKKIKTRVKKQMEKSQKEYYLNEQMHAIQKELGERDEFKAEIAEIEKALKEKKLSEEASKKVKKELRKLKMMSPMSAEATVVRNYIDWIITLPWGFYTKDKDDLKAAHQILEEDHYGLKKIKNRILEHLAVQSLANKVQGPLLCLVGPPGVGKTSLARSIARALGRKFVRASLGGVRDEAEIRGHRRTYIGALPGKIIQSMKKAGSQNPVFLLDEIDKMAMDFRGDPAAALLEVLDPEQNVAFNDHYLEIDYDLSKILFIATANSIHNIPRPLLDRMEMIFVAGYTDEEKLHIAQKFLVPKQKELNGLKEYSIKFYEKAVLTIIHKYTKEAGVRNLEREIANIYRKMAKKIVEKGKNKKVMLSVTSKTVEELLGTERYHSTQTENKDEVGLTNGLAWTEMGGELLAVECTIMPGKGAVTITGQLGEVMQESARAALSYVRSRGESLGLSPDFNQKVDLHLHVPEGAIPKDGPSAGITMATCLVSALLRVPVRKEVAMTGEITLRGRVLPIGGLKEKLLAAYRAGIKTVLVPKENERDLKDVPKKVLSSLKIVLVSHMDEVLKKALLVKNPEHIFQGPGNKSKKELKSSFYFRKKPTYMTRAPLVGTA
ncbi:MAG: endopeptidase La [Deltaproteobacteria bacterium GWA2_38_16]|nr:MAG: endopeptidase La [Deltaproteobacteria bacterium GWA2_38_16]OGQ02531.1 MAG: endopeptidase La [Deltaproteobacteria bacterium RIFCSPHIGHO2_02_FULL_38_15]OGQ60252.1 MAG: endopeptidase La [Deltaproteobacteria bacterium RIFCSPLOWO2_12_FULL_38_8]HBQ21014.1 endopeptidase La [Deltaproteobacteria bacterium]